MDFKTIIKKRYASKSFSGEMISEEKFKELQEIIQLSASSYGLQPYKIIVIKDKESKEKLLPASYNQKQITTCSHLLVFCADTKVSERINQYEQLMINNGFPKEKAKAYTDIMRSTHGSVDESFIKCWTQRQIYIAIGNAINGAKALGFDSCPMEGFNPEEYKKILDIPNNLIPTALVTIGITNDTPRPKIRFPINDLFI